MNTLFANEQAARVLLQSRQRSVDYGLRSNGSVDACHLQAGELNSRLQEYAQMLEHLRECSSLFSHLQGGKQSRMLLADRSGTILHSSGCNRFGSKAGRLTLVPGACWAEANMGTNAIGTALVEQGNIQVLGAQHFMQANHGISCSASPLFDGNGRLLAVLDISSEEHQHSRDMLFAARLLSLCLENSLLASQDDVCWLLNIAADSAHMQQPWSGMIALDEAGRVLGANRLARTMLDQFQPGQFLRQLQPGQITSWNGSSVLLTRKQQPAARVSVAMPGTAPEAAIQEAVDQCALKLLDAGIALLIQGETGTGKDHMVRQLHAASARAQGPLVAVNCGALPAELIEAELFGYRPGAFTGSDKNGRLGYVRAADKGILFLDEIGELPPAAQTRLLRVLQDKVVTPLGSHQAETVDFQLVAASNRSLPQMVARGSFREDLYYRLNGYLVELRPLRDYSREEFVRLVSMLLAPASGKQAGVHDRQVLDFLAGYSWPGNIRQLKNALEVALVLADGQRLEIKHFPGLGGQQTATPSPHGSLQQNTIEHALRVLESCDGNISAAARKLGVSRTTLYSYLKKQPVVNLTGVSC